MPGTSKEPASAGERERAANHQPEAARKRCRRSQTHSSATREQVGFGWMDEAGWGVKFRQVNMPRGRDGLHTALAIRRCQAQGRTPQQNCWGAAAAGLGTPEQGCQGSARLRGRFFPRHLLQAPPLPGSVAGKAAERKRAGHRSPGRAAVLGTRGDRAEERYQRRPKEKHGGHSPAELPFRGRKE